jgi:hypothetical protein
VNDAYDWDSLRIKGEWAFIWAVVVSLEVEAFEKLPYR